MNFAITTKETLGSSGCSDLNLTADLLRTKEEQGRGEGGNGMIPMWLLASRRELVLTLVAFAESQ